MPLTLSVATTGQSRRPVRQPAKTRTSSVWLAAAKGTARRLSSVREGRNGAMIQRVAVLDQAEGRDVDLACGAGRGDDGLDDTRHQPPSSRLARLAFRVSPSGA